MFSLFSSQNRLFFYKMFAIYFERLQSSNGWRLVCNCLSHEENQKQKSFRSQICVNYFWFPATNLPCFHFLLLILRWACTLEKQIWTKPTRCDGTFELQTRTMSWSNNESAHFVSLKSYMLLKTLFGTETRLHKLYLCAIMQSSSVFRRRSEAWLYSGYLSFFSCYIVSTFCTEIATVSASTYTSKMVLPIIALID